MRDINLVKENISKMIEQNAPEADIDQYVASEGYTPEMLRGEQQVPQTPTDEPIARTLLRPAGQAAMGLPNAFANAGIGAIQAGADLGDTALRLIDKAYFGNSLANEKLFGERLAEQVKIRREEQSKLPAAERVGIAIGETLPYLTTGVGTVAITASGGTAR